VVGKRSAGERGRVGGCNFACTAGQNRGMKRDGKWEGGTTNAIKDLTDWDL
jgi:hypothetical protein